MIFGGKIDKMKIIPYNPVVNNLFPGTGALEAEALSVLINPESYTLNHRVEFENRTAAGVKLPIQYKYHHPEVLNFQFLFDGTGVIPELKSGLAAAISNVPAIGALGSAATGLFGKNEKSSVNEQIEKFKKTTLLLNSNIHSPRPVKLLWGKLNFKCRLTALSLEYKLFTSEGEPLRVIAKATFTETPESTLQELLLANFSSPDITHSRVVKEGDTLPLLTYEVYGDASYYLQVAKANNLINFNKLKPGDVIYFPPIKKQP